VIKVADSKQTIVSRLLSYVSNLFDKSANSLFYHNFGALAEELQPKYAELDTILDEAFAETVTSLENMIKIAADEGVEHKEATYATGSVTLTGTVGATVAIGDLVASDLVQFSIQEAITIPAEGTISVAVKCNTAGTIGNVPIGAIKYFPVTLPGILSVNNIAATQDGYEAESLEELRTRYYEQVRTPSTSGNKYHYINWAKSIAGIGGARCIPLWNGNGTIKVIVINSDHEPASEALVTSVTNYIEAERPIGPTVTVISATGLALNITATLVLAPGFTKDQVDVSIQENIKTYLKGLDYSDTTLYVSYARIGEIILNTSGIVDYSNLTINGGIINIVPGGEQVPIMGTLTTTV
jgi:uncharacterized phage protein gp47/JayE